MKAAQLTVAYSMVWARWLLGFVVFVLLDGRFGAGQCLHNDGDFKSQIHKYLREHNHGRILTKTQSKRLGGATPGDLSMLSGGPRRAQRWFKNVVSDDLDGF